MKRYEKSVLFFPYIVLSQALDPDFCPEIKKLRAQ
jgi:hypothetical protein